MQPDRTAASLDRPRARYLFVTLSALIAAGAVFQLVDALGWIPTGPAPGEGPTGSFVVTVAVFALIATAIACAVLAQWWQGAPALAWLVAPACGLLQLATFYSFDDYCGGHACRISGEVSAGAVVFVWVLAGASVLAGLLTAHFPRAGLRATAIVAIVALLSVAFVPAGH